MHKVKWVLSVLLLPMGVASAADVAADAARQCAQITDSLQRLVCFDRAYSAAAPAAAAPAAAAPAVVATPALPPAPAAKPVEPAAAPALGDDSVRKKIRKQEAEVPTSLTATVSALKEMRPGVFRLTLENGQIWEQEEGSSLFSVKQGDSVQINKGKFGGYQLARVSDGRSGWVRVTRVK